MKLVGRICFLFFWICVFLSSITVSGENDLLHIKTIYKEFSISQNLDLEDAVIPPSLSPTLSPTEERTNSPTESPTEHPTENPTEYPTEFPTEQPSETPSVLPSEEPSVVPSMVPSFVPTLSLSSEPSVVPSIIPTPIPSLSHSPTIMPSFSPSQIPTIAPSTLSPTSEPSYQNRPIIRVECNITLFNVTASTLTAYDLDIINRATALVLSIPSDRLSTVRWNVVASFSRRRRLFDGQDSAAKEPSLESLLSDSELPTSLWDVGKDLAEKSEGIPQSEDSEFGSDIFYDSSLDASFMSPVINGSESILTSSYFFSNQNDSLIDISTESSTTKEVVVQKHLRFVELQQATNRWKSSMWQRINSFSSGNDWLAALMSIQQRLSRFLLEIPFMHQSRDKQRGFVAAEASKQRTQQSVDSTSWIWGLTASASSSSPLSSMISIASRTVTYEYSLTLQVEVMMVDFPEYRSITNGTRLMNYLRQRIRYNLRTGNYSLIMQRLLNRPVSSPTMVKTTALAGVTATRVVLRNQGLIFAPSFSPTAAPARIKATEAVATSVAGVVVGVILGALCCGGLGIILVSRHAEHEKPPPAIELKSLDNIEGAAASKQQTENDLGAVGARTTKTGSGSRGGGDKKGKTGKSNAASGKILSVTASSDVEHDPQLSPHLKKKPAGKSFS